MADEKELEIKITWRSGEYFMMEAKPADEWVTVVGIDGKGSVSQVWTPIETICKDFLSIQLAIIGEEMQT